jgi:hypothetical protein
LDVFRVMGEVDPLFRVIGASTWALLNGALKTTAKLDT